MMGNPSIPTVVASKPGELPRPIPEVGAAVDAYSEIQAALPGRPRWQLVAFAAGCAQRLLPMAASLGEPAMAEPTQAGVALAWNAAAGRTVQPELEQAISDLRQAMEAAREDRLGLKLLAAWAMDLTVFALKPPPPRRRPGARRRLLREQSTSWGKWIWRWHTCRSSTG
jgi:hypothetical protein